MVYVHDKQLDERLVRHWANESESADDMTATFKIRQVETGIVYSEAIDVAPCRYTYEATDEPEDTGEEATAEDYENALGRFGV